MPSLTEAGESAVYQVKYCHYWGDHGIIIRPNLGLLAVEGSVQQDCKEMVS